MKKGNKGSATVWAIIIILIFVIIVGGYFFWRFFLSEPQELTPGQEKQIEEASEKTSPEEQPTSESSQMDSKLVGTWVSDCLVPDPDSDWAEKHQFEIKNDGTAVHTRWSDTSGLNNCEQNSMTLVNNYKCTTVEEGKINLYDTDEGVTIYDIYQVMGNNLTFGHGFRGDSPSHPYPKNQGDSSENRIESLNKYIIYKKK
jgi:hypothetical protein